MRIDAWELWAFVTECPECRWLEAPSLLREDAVGKIAGKYICSRCDAVWLYVWPEQATSTIALAAVACNAPRCPGAAQGAPGRARGILGPRSGHDHMSAHTLAVGAPRTRVDVCDPMRRGCHHRVAQRPSGRP